MEAGKHNMKSHVPGTYEVGRRAWQRLDEVGLGALPLPPPDVIACRPSSPVLAQHGATHPAQHTVQNPATGEVHEHRTRMVRNAAGG